MDNPTDKILDDLTSPIKKANKVGLAGIQTELKEIKTSLKKTADGTDPTPGRIPLNNVIPFTSKDSATRTLQNSTLSESNVPVDSERQDRLQRLGTAIQEKIGIERGGSLNNTQTNTNASVFEKFIKQSKDQEAMLRGANDEQREIFKNLESTLIELRGAGSEDSQKLRDTLAKLRGQLDATENTEAKGKIAYRMDTANAGGRNNNLGNVLQALLGKESLIKTGYEREGQNIRNTDTGQFASRAEAGRGRLSSAFGMLGSYIGQKAEEGVEGKRSDRFQGFLDRNFRTQDSTESAARLSGEIQGLKNTKVNTGKVTEPKALAAVMTRASAVTPSKTNVINIRSDRVNVTGGSGAGSATMADLAPKIAEKSRAASPMLSLAAAATAPAAAPAEQSSNFMDMAGGAMAAKTLGGGGFLAKIGGVGTVAKGVGIGGAAALVGTGMQYGSDKLKESGYEKTGQALGVAGTATKYAGYGAMIGSVIPGVGTAVGAGIGGIVGAGKGIYDQYYANSKEKTVSSSEESSHRIDMSDPNNPKFLINEKEVDANTYDKIANMDPDEAVDAIRNLKGNQVQNLSSQNDAAKTAKSTTPIIVPAPATPAASSKTTMMLPRGNMRPTESALERYTARGSSFL